MSTPHGPSVPHVQASDPAAARQNLEDFTRRVLAVPKKKIDAMLAKERSGKKHRIRHH
jgi:hypothetical protein